MYKSWYRDHLGCFRSISTVHHLPLLKLQSKRPSCVQSSPNPTPLVSSYCSPGSLFLRLLSSSTSTTLLPPTTTYEELCTALVSEDVLVVDVRQVLEKCVLLYSCFFSLKSWLRMELSLVQWTSPSSKLARCSPCLLNSGSLSLACPPLKMTRQLSSLAWLASEVIKLRYCIEIGLLTTPLVSGKGNWTWLFQYFKLHWWMGWVGWKEQIMTGGIVENEKKYICLTSHWKFIKIYMFDGSLKIDRNTLVGDFDC